MNEEMLNESDDVRDKELKDLERLVLILNKRDKTQPLIIEGNSVYGRVDNKKTYLMSYDEFKNYTDLCSKYKTTAKKREKSKRNAMDPYKDCEEFFRGLS